MVDVVLAGSREEDFSGIVEILKEAGENVARIEMEITDNGFQSVIADRETGVIISRFHEGDLASIKAMQAIKAKKPYITFLFISQKQLSSSVLTLMFNEGASGVLQEPLSSDTARLLVKKAIKRYMWEMDGAMRCEDMLKINESLKARLEMLEQNFSRSINVRAKLERLVYFLLSNDTFKTSLVKLLIVSDSPYQLGVLLEKFGEIGFNVKGVETAEEALKEIKSYKPGIIVSDLELPGMSGVDLAKKIKGTKGTSISYFVILTSSEDKMDFILSPETLVDDCVLKPGDTSKYHEMVSKVALGLLEI